MPIAWAEGDETPANSERATGSIDESFQTSLFTGSYNRQIPIAVPPGTRLQPVLSLSYNSGTVGSQTILGAGWSLSGLGTIERSTKGGVPLFDETNGDPSTGTDQLLLMLGGTFDLVHIPTDVDSPYHSRRENFLRIQFFPITHPDSVWGGFPTVYWLVTDKNGTQFRYGFNGDSNIIALSADGTTKNVTLSWQLDRVTDMHGNYIEIDYLQNVSDGGVYPSKITYTKNDTAPLSFYRTVDFNYEPRPDSIKDFSGGSYVKIDRRLESIETRVNTTLVKKYVLSYVESPASGKSLFKSIQTMGSDANSGSPTLLPPTVFSYQENQVGWTQDSAWGATIPGVLSKDSKFNGLQVVDVNGDSLPDFVKSAEEGGVMIKQVWLNTGSAWTTTPDPIWSTSIPVTFFKEESNGDQTDNGVRLVDINGDGLPDFAKKTSASDSNVWLNTGNGWAATPDFTWTDALGGVPSFTSGGIRVLDLNGDGFPEIVQHVAQISWLYNFCELPDQLGAFCTVKPAAISSVGRTRSVWRNTRTGWEQDSNLTSLLSALPAFQTTIVKRSVTNCADIRNTQGAVVDCFASVSSPSVIIPSDSYTRFADVNGDGLSDIVTSLQTVSGIGGGSVYLNDGDGWTYDLAYSNAVPKALADLSYQSTDSKIVPINGGRAADFVSLEFGNPGVFLNRFLGWQQIADSAWTAAISSLPRARLTNDRHQMEGDFIDLNGDGLLDYLYSVQTGSATTQRVYIAKGPVPDLLSRIQNSAGGITTLTYKSAAQYLDNNGALLNRNIPYPLQTVESITRQSGTAGSPNIVTNYRYSGGLFDGASKEFRGFRSVRVTDAIGTYSETFFLQDSIFKGKTDYSDVRDINDSLYSRVDSTWDQINPLPGLTFTFLKQQDQYLYDGLSSPKQTRTNYEYDVYGNTSRVTHSGDLSVSGDERTSGVDFLHLDTPSSYMISLPKKKFITAAAGNILSLSWFDYDNQANGALPTKGNLTQIKNWDSEGNDLVSTFMFDVYGNPTGGIDPRQNRSEIKLDPLFHSFPISETNAKNQSVQKRYYGIDVPLGPEGSIPGLLASVTDLNKVTASFTYDALGRKKTEIIPPDTSTSPTTTFTYNLDGVAPESTSLSIKDLSPSGGGILVTTTFTDGLGRVIQSKKEAPSSSQEVLVNTTYDIRGKVESVSIPYFASAVSGYTIPSVNPKSTFEYDVVGRSSKVNNPDGSIVSTLSSLWEKTLIDANGRKRVEVRDAYGNMVEVQEYKGHDGRNPSLPSESYSLYATTRYEYDLQGKLTKVIDDAGNETILTYDTLARKRSMRDPDMGFWTYEYDANGNLRHQRDAKGQSIFFSYDPLDRMVSKGAQNDQIPPSVPTNLIANATTPGVVDLTWNVATDNSRIQRYDVFRDGVSVKSTLSASLTESGLLPLTSYSYTVVAVDVSGNKSPASTPVNVITLADTQTPSPPGNLIANSVSETQINLSWSAATDDVAVSGYKIERSTDALTFSEVGVSPNPSYSDTELSASITYYYRVRVFDAGGNQSGFSSIVSAGTFDLTNPGIPSSLVLTPINETQINLSWAAAADNVGVTEYVVERSINAGASWPFSFSTSLTAYSSTGLSYGTNYAFRVSAKDGSGNIGTPSAKMSGKTIDVTPPTPAPVITSAIPLVGGTEIDIAGTGSVDNIGGVRYWFKVCVGAGCDPLSVPFPYIRSAMTFKFYGTPQTVYRFAVAAVDDFGNESTWSPITQVTTPVDGEAPSNVLGFRAQFTTTNGSARVVLTWSAATDNVQVINYRIERKLRTATVWAFLMNRTGPATTADPEIADASISLNTIYDYRVKAYDGVNFSADWSTSCANTDNQTQGPTFC